MASLDDLEDRLSCGLCMEIYDEQTHVPKLLHCAHSLCKPCLQSLTSSKTDRTFPCPFCREPIPVLNINRYRSNLTLLDMLPLLVGHGGGGVQGASSLSLKSVGRAPVVQQYADRSRQTSDAEASVTSLSSSQSNETNESDTPEECSKHGNPATCFCSTCSANLCTECLIQDMREDTHKGHDLVSVCNKIQPKQHRDIANPNSQISETSNSEIHQVLEGPSSLPVDLNTRRGVLQSSLSLDSRVLNAQSQIRNSNQVSKPSSLPLDSNARRVLHSNLSLDPRVPSPPAQSQTRNSTNHVTRAEGDVVCQVINRDASRRDSAPCASCAAFATDDVCSFYPDPQKGSSKSKTPAEQNMHCNEHLENEDGEEVSSDDSDEITLENVTGFLDDMLTDYGLDAEPVVDGVREAYQEADKALREVENALSRSERELGETANEIYTNVHDEVVRGFEGMMGWFK